MIYPKYDTRIQEQIGLTLLILTTIYVLFLVAFCSIAELNVICKFSDVAKIVASILTIFLAYSTLSLWFYKGAEKTKFRQTLFYLEVILLLGIILNFAVIYSANGVDGLSPAQTIGDYIYFSIVTFTTLGYGELHPVREFRAFAAWQAVFGFIYVPIVLAEIFHRIGR